MNTLELAWVNAKYKHNYELLFVGTFIIDLKIIEWLLKLTT